ncbi:hypothetical protein J6590_101481 [Homalodisca vitripennis]|nr:hypothetical protein J6590_101481 [Homalodisca vitripennis]
MFGRQTCGRRSRRIRSPALVARYFVKQEARLLNEWQRCCAPSPKEVVTDDSKTLQSAVCRSFSRCKRNCFTKFDDIDKALIQDSLYADLQSKDEQDLYLQRLIEVTNDKQHRIIKDGASQRVSLLKYLVLVQENKVEVSREAFFKHYDVTEKRTKRIRKLLLEGKSPTDKRSRHPCSRKIRPNKLF